MPQPRTIAKFFFYIYIHNFPLVLAPVYIGKYVSSFNKACCLAIEPYQTMNALPEMKVKCILLKSLMNWVSLHFKPRQTYWLKIHK